MVVILSFCISIYSNLQSYWSQVIQPLWPALNRYLHPISLYQLHIHCIYKTVKKEKFNNRYKTMQTRIFWFICHIFNCYCVLTITRGAPKCLSFSQNDVVIIHLRDLIHQLISSKTFYNPLPYILWVIFIAKWMLSGFLFSIMYLRSFVLFLLVRLKYISLYLRSLFFWQSVITIFVL